MPAPRLAPVHFARECAVITALSLAACRAPHLPVGTSAPKITAEWLRGEPVDPATAQSIVVVDLFATWCGPCMDTIDELDALQRRYAGHGVRVVALAVRDGREPVERFVAERGRDHAYAIAFDATGKSFDAWRSNALPTSYVVGQDGVIVAVTHPRGLDWQVATALLGRTRGTAQSLAFHEAAKSAREAKNWSELEQIADQRLHTEGASVPAWIAKVEAQRDPAASAAVARTAIAAMRDDAFSLAELVHGLALRGRLCAVGLEAHAALERARCNVPSLYVRTARVRAAHAAGPEALPALEAALLDELREQPVELLAVVSPFALGLPWLSAEPPLAVQPDPQALHAFRVRLLEIASKDLPGARVDEPLLDALVAAKAGEPRVTEVGRRIVAREARNADALNSLAWWLLREGEPDPVALPTVHAAVDAMTAIPGWETAMRLDTVALARFVAGDVDEAVRLQERAIAMLPSPKASYERALARYRGARDERAKR